MELDILSYNYNDVCLSFFSNVLSNRFLITSKKVLLKTMSMFVHNNHHLKVNSIICAKHCCWLYIIYVTNQLNISRYTRNMLIWKRSNVSIDRFLYVLLEHIHIMYIYISQYHSPPFVLFIKTSLQICLHHIKNVASRTVKIF